jgi:hypothetical protein
MRYQARTIDLCEGGMAIQFMGRSSAEPTLRFSLELPGTKDKLELWGEVAWEGDGDRAGVRFKNVSDEQRKTLRDWLNTQLPEREPDDPPVISRVTSLSQGGCYLSTTSPFPKSTRVILSVGSVRADGVVRLAHPEFGMGVEFLQGTPERQDHVRKLVESLRASGENPEVQVEPNGLEGAASDEATAGPASSRASDSLVNLFRQQPQVSVEVFIQHMQQQQRHAQQSG